jgi:hypothetical protein
VPLRQGRETRCGPKGSPPCSTSRWLTSGTGLVVAARPCRASHASHAQRPPAPPLPLQELRRGADQARIFSLSFSKDCAWLAVSSDKGTVHVFSLSGGGTSGGGSGGGSGPPAGAEEAGGASPGGSDGGAKQRQNPTSMLSFVKSMVPIPMPK